MFIKGKFGHIAQTKLKVYKEGRLLSVIEANQLLSLGRHQSMLKQVRDFCGLSDEHFELLYQPVVQRFAELVQVLPSQHKAGLSGLLNEGLTRATKALAQYQIANTSVTDPLINYAIFTAGLLADVSKVVINQKIIVTTAEGECLDEWNPFAGSLIDLDTTHYRMLPLAPVYQRIADDITLLLARQLLPRDGFLWLTRDLDIFADWLDALRGDDSQGGRISRALALIRRDDILTIVHAMAQTDIDQIESSATEYGEAFYAWLKENIASGDLKVNTADAGVHVVAEGVFLERKLFKQFAEIMSLPVSALVVFAQFGNLIGLVKESSGAKFDQYFSQYPEISDTKSRSMAGGPLVGRQMSQREGAVIAEAGLVFANTVPEKTPMLKSMQSQLPKSHQSPTVVQQLAAAKLSSRHRS